MKSTQAINKDVLSLLINYFEAEVPLLVESYNWRIPYIEGFERSLEKGLSANIALKHFLNKLWHNSEKTDLEVANIIIKDWGGVKGNKTKTLQRYIDRVNNHSFEMPFQGLASYTKLYSIVEPTRFAIYDARVAVTLNALQCNAGVKSGIAFNYLSGRNNVTGNSTNKQGFSQQPEYSISNLVSRGWQRVAKEETYQVYLNYLFACLEHNPKWKLYELEMVLFANAEKEAKTAMQGNQNVSLNETKTVKVLKTKKQTNHQAIFDFVTDQKLLTSPFSFSQVSDIAKKILLDVSKSGQEYASLKFVQKFCNALDKDTSVQLQNTSDPRKIENITYTKTECSFELLSCVSD